MEDKTFIVRVEWRPDGLTGNIHVSAGEREFLNKYVCKDFCGWFSKRFKTGEASLREAWAAMDRLDWMSYFAWMCSPVAGALRDLVRSLDRVEVVGPGEACVLEDCSEHLPHLAEAYREAVPAELLELALLGGES